MPCSSKLFIQGCLWHEVGSTFFIVLLFKTFQKIVCNKLAGTCRKLFNFLTRLCVANTFEHARHFGALIMTLSKPGFAYQKYKARTSNKTQSEDRSA
jgi:hypothetical protein